MPGLVTASGISGRRTLVSWSCVCKSDNPGSVRICPNCGHDRIERHAQVAASERAVVFRNPMTGEIRRPPRADMPMDPKYAAQGYQREEIMSMIQHEKETGSVHEASSFLPGNEPMPDDRPPQVSCPKELKESLIKDIMDAHQSGNWTLDQPLRPSTDQ